jgi:hypothetical protein
LITEVDEGSPTDEIALLDLQEMIQQASTLLAGQIDNRLRDHLDGYIAAVGNTTVDPDSVVTDIFTFEDTPFEDES